MRGDAFLGKAVHFFGSDLELDALTLGADDRGMERLVEVGLGHADKILEASRHGRPERMDEPENGVAIYLGIGDDPDRDQVVDVLKSDPLFQHLLIDAVKVLGPALYLAL